ncbi:YggW family oxidoreductase [Snodgrassella alvi]|jgi:putative oxygen-independent coproporphyrinogen III oxidase|uniref:radical SAM family heme chaperone HemW n=1 Tax=Snodgrassella alvi TaxID=1196083 RepID=UPI000C1E4C46|nr:radical SAM family heme chaperone HemW [Snodgrassella alvi]PIT14690.1 YggW family oxidoreductase [Snodgrassella alvi]PIT57579.1 YggW family oxidoreductase [Snodgrassella alvi]
MSEISVSLQTPWNQFPLLSCLPPLSLYIHIPWCVRKCPYCDFNSHQLKQELNEQAYIAALLTDLETELPYFWGRTVQTIFIGGGTPSLFSAAAFEQLLSGIRARVNLLPAAEITLEANPGTFERNRFAAFAAAGINRLSIGVQSFANDKLTTLGRIHNRDEALSAIESGLTLFPKVNIDLMYALPGQTVKQAKDDIHTAISTGVQHISAYQLTLEPNTPFAHSPPPQLPDDDHIADIEDTVHTALLQAGFTHYETSAFAQPQQECWHNLNYWQFGDYIGIGAGAHGKISNAQEIIRTTRSRHPKDYLQAMQQQPQRAITRQPVSVQDLPFEFMLNALRLTGGVPSAWFSERTGLPLSVIQHAITQAVERGLLDANPLYLRPTKLGRSFLNDLLALFLKA